MSGSGKAQVKQDVAGEHLKLSDQMMLDMYRKMLLARVLCEKMWVLNRQGKAPFVVSCEGQEAAQVGMAYALKNGDYFALPYYRDLAVALALGETARDLMLNLLARAADPNGAGRQMPGHLSNRRLKIAPHSSPVATQIPHAVGVALAAKIKREPTVVGVSFGDGAANKGDFHEGLGFAGVHRLPVVFFCENNAFAISVPLAKRIANPHIADMAASYGFPGIVVDGNDVVAVYDAVRVAVDRARAGDGPTLIEALTYRYAPHSSNDDDKRYRARSEVNEWRTRDPIERFQVHLRERGILTDEIAAAIRQELAEEVSEAAEFAEKSATPRPEEALAHVYKD